MEPIFTYFKVIVTSKILFIIGCFICITTFGQVGIGNISPNAQLDISASNVTTPTNTDGILIPRIDDFPSTNPTIAQDGMMIFATGVGTPAKGFYYWDQNTTSWVSIVGSSDHDWYEEGTTNAPNAITDDVFTQGNVAIGKSMADYPVDVQSNSNLASPIVGKFEDAGSGTGTHTGIEVEMGGGHGQTNVGVFVNNTSSDSGLRTGFRANLRNASNNQTGVDITIRGTSANIGVHNNILNSGAASNVLTRGISNNIGQPSTFGTYGNENVLYATGANASGNKYAIHNTLLNGFGNHYGTYNANFSIENGNKYGVYNTFGSIAYDTGGTLYGTYNNFDTNLTSTSAKYGTHTIIPSSLGGTHYGIYSDVQNATGYAGYFVGRISLGDGTTNRYLMPSADGLAGQVLTTDGSGQVNWAASGGSTASVVRVNLSTNQALPSGSQKLLFDTVIFDTNNEFDSVNNRFVAAGSGYYQINAAYYALGTGSNNLKGIQVYVNGALYQESISAENLAGIYKSLTGIIFLNANDYVEVYANIPVNTFTVHNTAARTFFEISKID